MVETFTGFGIREAWKEKLESEKRVALTCIDGLT